MLTPDYLEHLPDAMVTLWQRVEDDILLDIARRIKAMDAVDPLTPTAQWQAWRLEQTRASRGDVTKTLAKYADRSDQELRKLLQDAGTETLANEDERYQAAGVAPIDLNSNKSLLNLLNAGYRQTKGSWKNLTATTAKTVSGELEKRLDRAWLQVSSGAFDYGSAIRHAVDDLAKNMQYVTYPSGHRDTLEVAVRRCVLTGANQTAAKLQLARAEEGGCAFVEVTAHQGARPTHAAWQGKVYHVGGAVVQDGERYEDFETATGYGTAEGLCGINCRHNFYPFWPGISERAYTDEKLAALADPAEYEQSQQRRALERQVRRYKRQYLAEKAAELDATGTAAKLRDAQQALAEFIKDTGGKVDGARTSVAGFGSKQSKAAQEDAKAFTEAENRAILEKTELQDAQYGQKPVTAQSIEAVKPFACDTLDEAGQQRLAEAHRELLRQVQDKPLGTEMARCYGPDMRPLGGYVTSDTDGEHKGSVKIPDFATPYVAIHNHPSGLTFSPGDLTGFAKSSNMRMLTVVGNDGTIYAIEKNANTNNAALLDLTSTLAAEINQATSQKDVMRLLNSYFAEVTRYGIQYHTRAN